MVQRCPSFISFGRFGSKTVAVFSSDLVSSLNPEATIVIGRRPSLIMSIPIFRSDFCPIKTRWFVSTRKFGLSFWCFMISHRKTSVERNAPYIAMYKVNFSKYLSFVQSLSHYRMLLQPQGSNDQDHRPAPVAPDCKPQRSRGVRCIRWFGDQTVHISKTLRPALTRTGSDDRPDHCAQKSKPRIAQIARIKNHRPHPCHPRNPWSTSPLRKLPPSRRTQN